MKPEVVKHEVPAHLVEWAGLIDFRAAVGRAISGLRSQRRVAGLVPRPLWAAVRDMLAVGGTYATRYCTLFGFDPDEEVWVTDPEAETVTDAPEEDEGDDDAEGDPDCPAGDESQGPGLPGGV